LTRSTDFLETILWTADERTRLGYLGQQLPARSMTFDLVRQLQTPKAAAHLARWSLTRKNLLVRISAEIQAVARASKDEALRADAERLRILRATLAELNLAGSAQEVDRVTGLEEELRNLERKLGAKIRAFRRPDREPSLQELSATLGSAALVDFFVYWSGDTESYRLIALVLQGGNARIVDLGESAEAEAQVTALRSAWVAEGDEGALASDLHMSLWEPLGLDDTKQVYVVPDGFLHLLPFAALQGPTGRRLVEDVELRVLSSARDLVFPDDAPAGKGTLLGVNPKFNPPRGTERRLRGSRFSDLVFTPLPGTRVEGRKIAALMRRRGMRPRTLTGRRLTEDELIKVERPRWLHLATHGFFLDSELPSVEGGRGLVLEYRPPRDAGNSKPEVLSESQAAESAYPLLRSGLALAGANRGLGGRGRRDGADGILTAMEVLSMDLAGTELVVLSACETGLGTRYEGQGVAGLRSAFQEAGAKAVLATLWSIDDAATQRFMVEFYQRVLSGTEAAVALREVQRVFLNDPAYGSPFFWAPFVLVGD
ncbi:MAG: CHAT domain-containing protein, partial [Myxococcota bacterium]